VLRKLWTEDLVTFQGRWHHLDRVGIAPRPKRQIPIWIGGGFTEPILKRVARLADGWMPLFTPGLDEEAIIGRLRSHLAAEGRDVNAFGLQVSLRPEPGHDEEFISRAKHLQSLGATHIGIGDLRHLSTTREVFNEAIRGLELLQAAIGVS
jgi:alkanesulfonate monooxygenase SsuD/methylene tetrahydromethanopterin reductase-like flavin-dependent oxidoreductase (luciferase family)